MNKQIWLNKEINLLEELDKGQYDLLLEYVRDNQQHLIAKWTEVDTMAFQKIARYGMSVLKYFEKHLQSDMKNKVIFRLGTLMGTVEIFEYLLYEKKQDCLTDKRFKEKVMSVKHLDEIILLLELQGIMSHTEICKCLNLKESTLSEIMKKVNTTKMISYSKSGKYKLYTLTEDGRRLAKMLRSSINENIYEKELLKQLQLFCEREYCKKEFVEKVYNIIEREKSLGSSINLKPGDDVTIYYDEQGKVEKDRYEMIGIMMDRKRNEDSLKVMAKKIKYDYKEMSNNMKEEGCA